MKKDNYAIFKEFEAKINSVFPKISDIRLSKPYYKDFTENMFPEFNKILV